MGIRLGANPRGARGGSALAAALVGITVIASLGAAMIQMHVAASRRQMMSIDTKRALYVAEAGLSEAFFAISQGKTGNVGSEALPASFGDGVYWVEALDEGGGQVRLESTGLCGAGRFALSMILERRFNSVASLGVFGGQEVVVGAGSVLDGFDSDEDGRWEAVADGTSGIPATGDGARVTSNGDVVIAGTPESVTRIYGDVTPGPLGTAILDGSAVVTGSTAPGRRVAELPPIEVPEVPTSGNLVHSSSTPLVLGPGEVHYTRLQVRSGSSVHVVGPVTVVVDDLYLEADAELAFDSSEGGIVVHSLEDIDLALGSRLTNLADEPQSTALLISARPTITTTPSGGGAMGLGGLGGGGSTTTTPALVRLLAGGEYHGLIYAPDVTLAIPRTLRVFGAVAGARLDLEDGSRISFDEALAGSGIGVSALPRLVSWRVVELPDSPLVRRRVNPFKTLAEQGITPMTSSSAHLEQHAQILYRPAGGGSLRVFTGLLSDLVWSTVGEVRNVGWIRPADWSPADAGDVLHIPGVTGLQLPNIPGVNGVVNLLF